MRKRLRKFLTFVTITAVAVAGVLPAHQAMAASHPQPLAQAVAEHAIFDCHHQGTALQNTALQDADHGTGGTHPGAHHDAVPSHHHDGAAPNGATAPDYACCATACAAIAFIFSTFSFDHSTIREVFDRPLTRTLRPATSDAIDPPPRMG
jgi:hypothetical protein